MTRACDSCLTPVDKDTGIGSLHNLALSQRQALRKRMFDPTYDAMTQYLGH